MAFSVDLSRIRSKLNFIVELKGLLITIKILFKTTIKATYSQSQRNLCEATRQKAG